MHVLGSTMSRLYIKNSFDKTKTGKRCHEKAITAIYWGSRDDSKLVVSVEVTWPKDGNDLPEVHLVYGERIKKASSFRIGGVNG